jgi:hypothetical protein
MTRFIEGRDRDRATLFPEHLDEAIEARVRLQSVALRRAGAGSRVRCPVHIGLKNGYAIECDRCDEKRHRRGLFSSGRPKLRRGIRAIVRPV